jgi:hypothetical protein
MSTSPKFRITIQGIAAGMRADRVYLALGKKFGLSPSQVEQLLANKAGPLVGLMEHQAAWTLRNELQQMGVDCSIAPAPRSHLGDTGNRISLQGIDPHRRIGQAPRMQRTPRHSAVMRSGRVKHVRRRPVSVRPAFSIPPLLRVAVVVAVAVVVGFSLQVNRERHTESLAVADSVP